MSISLEQYRTRMKHTLGTCAYELCGQPIHRNERHTRENESVYHDQCLEQQRSDKLSAEIDKHPFVHGTRRHTLVEVAETTN
jgi:hypothetical protein